MTKPSSFPKELRGSLWHTTHPDRYRRILESGFVVAEPPIPDSDRFKADRGPEYYSYVRTLGGVSLFDFVRFDPEAYSAKYPIASWWTFAPIRRDWGVSIWIEIDRRQLGDAFMSGLQLLKKWNEDGAHRHTIMPVIEAASLDPIPINAFRRILRFTSGKSAPEVLSRA